MSHSLFLPVVGADIIRPSAFPLGGRGTAKAVDEGPNASDPILLWHMCKINKNTLKIYNTSTKNISNLKNN